jgi:hypothetical protein
MKVGNKKQRNLYIVESPLQLLCAFEKSFSQSNVTFVIRMNGNSNNDNQILEVAGVLKINYIKKVLRPNRIKFDLIKNIMFFIRLLYSFDTYYLGSYHSKLLAFIRIFINDRKVVILDDGVATLLAQEEMKERNKSYNIFTFFELSPLPRQNVEQHSFGNLVQCFNIDYKNNKGSYFIGQKVVESGIITTEYYISIIAYAAQLAGSKKLIYIPHRGEGESVIASIKSIEGVEVRYLNKPVELYFLHEEIPPEVVYSIISTALNTLSIISRKTELFALIPRSLSEQKVPHIAQIISQLERNKKINIVLM